MQIPKIFKSPVFQGCIGVYAVVLFIMYNWSGLLPPVAVNIIMEVNSLVISYVVYDMYIKKK